METPNSSGITSAKQCYRRAAPFDFMVSVAFGVFRLFSTPKWRTTNPHTLPMLGPLDWTNLFAHLVWGLALWCWLYWSLSWLESVCWRFRYAVGIEGALIGKNNCRTGSEHLNRDGLSIRGRYWFNVILCCCASNVLQNRCYPLRGETAVEK